MIDHTTQSTMTPSNGHTMMLSHIRSYLQTCGYYTEPKTKNTKQLFLENAQYYYQGIIRFEFFTSLVDELLFESLVRSSAPLRPDLFRALMCASQLSSSLTRKDLNKQHTKLRHYLQSLESVH